MLVAMLAGPARAAAAAQIEFTQETLPNGLEVLYAPLHQAPVVHVRVLYHVGSRDERPDRQGFAHMFEHMMFRGSDHVKPEQHMKLIGMVGGYSNAFTSFDETVYVNTVPSSQLELALYLEADRMASFKVSDEIYRTERKVVTEEWRMKQNRPYGAIWESLFAAAFKVHSYRWTPIGDMNNLRAAQAAELQDFFNRYYVPNNAILVIAGDLDPAAARALVKKYYAWIPRGQDLKREIPAEPAQTEARSVEIKNRVPLAKVMVAYRAGPYKSDDNYGMGLLATILGGGRSSRLERTLVYGAKPVCVDAGVGFESIEDYGLFVLEATVLAGQDPTAVEKDLVAAADELRTKGVTPDELEKAKTQARLAIIHGRETAERIASELGQEAMFGGDPNRVNTALDKINALTAADLKALAEKYFLAAHATTLRVIPDPNAAVPEEHLNAPAESTRPIAARDVKFPEGYPAAPPVAATPPSPKFQKGTETTVAGVRVIVMPDARLPLVNWVLTSRRGTDSDPKDKAGLADLTASLVRRGAGGMTFAQINEDLERRGIGIEIAPNDDHTHLVGSCLTEQLDHALKVSRTILREPAFPADEFANRKQQVLNQLRMSEESPAHAAAEDLDESLFGSAPQGLHETPESVARITLDDVRAFYQANYRPNDAVLVLSGDITVERGQELAKALLADWPAAPMAPVDYALPKEPESRTVILVDRPAGAQSTVRMGLRSYDVHGDDKFAGDLASRILSSGIDSRLGRAVRAQKGLAYSVYGIFQPGRHGGKFFGATDTTLPSTADAVETMFKVFKDMAADGVTDEELAEAKLRVTGSMVMNMQTMAQQAGFRVDGILNGYPVDYYDKYPARVSQVTRDEVRACVQKYIRPERMVIVVVAPAAQVKEQLERLGPVKVEPMPAKRHEAPATPAAPAEPVKVSKPAA
jgi:zinc protease